MHKWESFYIHVGFNTPIRDSFHDMYCNKIHTHIDIIVKNIDLPFTAILVHDHFIDFKFHKLFWQYIVMIKLKVIKVSNINSDKVNNLLGLIHKSEIIEAYIG